MAQVVPELLPENSDEESLSDAELLDLPEEFLCERIEAALRFFSDQNSG
jgi:hypothetical protein